ncbi:MAG: pitrilysin family protein [Bryobacteraceae bacterium]|nr:pitrilysin family protein [Bryobacteraceae bacterium]
MMIAAQGWSAMIAQPGKSPLITIRVVFGVGAASDPAGKEGLASLTAAMIAEGGTARTPYKQIVDAMFPMATAVDWQVDKEMTAFVVETHADNLDRFYALFREMLLEPGWREEDLSRVKDQAVNFLRVSLRGNNDEELGKEVLYSRIYNGHPYGHHNIGRAGAIARITIGDLKQFYRRHYTRARLTVAVAGNYPAGFPERMEKDFAALPKGMAGAVKLPAVKAAEGRRLTLVEKDTGSVAMSIGFPIGVRRGHGDYVALLVAASWLGQHRSSGVRLYDRIREARGLDYGDYAYIEYFPRGMFLMEPEPNLARRQQIFQVWIRPVVPETAHFTLRLAFFELERLRRDGMGRDDFERTRNFLSKYVNLLMKTKKAELGYAIDSRYYGIPDYISYLKDALAKLTVDGVNRAVRRHMQLKNVRVVMVAGGCEELRKRIVGEAPSPMRYNSPKPAGLLEEDKLVERYALGISEANTRIVRADALFE